MTAWPYFIDAPGILEGDDLILQELRFSKFCPCLTTAVTPANILKGE
jgi:hypothetical protein